MPDPDLLDAKPHQFSPRARQVVAILLLVFGLQAWLTFGRSDWGRDFQLLWAFGAAAVMLIAPVRRAMLRLLEPLRSPSPRSRTFIAIALGLLSIGYILATAVYQDRPFMLMNHDEHMFAVQTQLLASGRLWLPQHPLADFFETFHVIGKPVYAAVHFPGTALLYAPGVWLKFPVWVMPLLTAGAIVALIYLIVTELLDGIAGVVAAFWMVSLTLFRGMALLPRSQTPCLLFALLLIFAFLSWRQGHRYRWALLMGIFAGWAAICRPLEALAYSLPIAVAILWDMRRESWRRIVSTVALGTCATIPFLSLQLIFNLGVTGSLLTTPHQFYIENEYPGHTFGFHGEQTNLRATSALPQKQQYYREFILPAIAEHQPDTIAQVWRDVRGYWTLKVCAPVLALLVLPVGLLGLNSAPRRVLFAALVLFLIGSIFTVGYLDEYALVVAPILIVLTLLGIRTLADAWPRARHLIAGVCTAFLCTWLLTSLPEFNRLARDVGFPPASMIAIHQTLATDVQAPAIVLFTWSEQENVHGEPVYNFTTANPDDAAIIRAHDLGPLRNVELYRYYAERQPARRVYRYDRETRELIDLGNVTNLAAQGASATTQSDAR